MFVSFWYKFCTDITTSSSAAFPALSPNPLIATCILSAPANIPAREFAVANPKSL